MRQIKASEVKPGMEVAFSLPRRMKVYKNTEGDYSERELEDVSGSIVFVGADTPVTVLSEPAPAQPEEPRWVAARAKLRDYRFFRVDESDRPWRKADCMGRVFPYRYSWSDVCSLGPVTVVPDQGWTVPAGTPEVPERIEEWPEDDTALRKHKWLDIDGCPWRFFGEDDWRFKTWEGGWSYPPRPTPLDGPWTRVSDA